jgi:hypothetical protein
VKPANAKKTSRGQLLLGAAVDGAALDHIGSFGQSMRKYDVARKFESTI